MPEPRDSGSSLAGLLKRSPVLGRLLVLSVTNWFVFFTVSMYFHGDALGTLPSRDGFVVASHGHHTAVSESVWLFSLIYSGASVLLTPPIWIAAALRLFSRERRSASRRARILTWAFVTLWCVGWYASLGSSIRRSVEDWQTLKRGAQGPLRPSPPADRQTRPKEAK